MNQRYLILTTPHYAGQVIGKTKNLCMAVMLQLQCAVCVVCTVIITRCHLSKSQGIISFYKFMEYSFMQHPGFDKKIFQMSWRICIIVTVSISHLLSKNFTVPMNMKSFVFFSVDPSFWPLSLVLKWTI